MAKTNADLRDRALRYLGLIQESDTATGYQADRADDAIEVSRQELIEYEVCYWADDSIPEEIYDHYARYIAGKVGFEFLTEERAIAWENIGEKALMKMKAMTSQKWSGQPTQTDKF